MKPFPEAVQKAFPCPPGRLPERPWWKPDGCSAFWRSNDQKKYVIEHPDQAADDDAKYPMSHPGYRAGQVWAAENGSSVVLMSTTNKSGWICHNLQGIAPVSLDSLSSLYPYLIADPACPHLAPWSPTEER
jgi:hypothetical protein